MRFSLGDAVFTVDPPALERYQEDEGNNSSLIVAIANGAHRLLFCGDAEDFRMAEYLKTDPGQFDFIKLPHHGRYQSMLEELLNVTQPGCALITSSADEPEETETMTLLSDHGVRTLLTRNGPVQIRCSANEFTAEYVH